jgi:hypothetical protein
MQKCWSNKNFPDKNYKSKRSQIQQTKMKKNRYQSWITASPWSKIHSRNRLQARKISRWVKFKQIFKCKIRATEWQIQAFLEMMQWQCLWKKRACFWVKKTYLSCLKSCKTIRSKLTLFTTRATWNKLMSSWFLSWMKNLNLSGNKMKWRTKKIQSTGQTTWLVAKMIVTQMDQRMINGPMR